MYVLSCSTYYDPTSEHRRCCLTAKNFLGHVACTLVLGYLTEDYPQLLQATHYTVFPTGTGAEHRPLEGSFPI